MVSEWPVISGEVSSASPSQNPFSPPGLPSLRNFAHLLPTTPTASAFIPFLKPYWSSQASAIAQSRFIGPSSVPQNMSYNEVIRLCMCDPPKKGSDLSRSSQETMEGQHGHGYDTSRRRPRKDLSVAPATIWARALYPTSHLKETIPEVI